MGTHPRALSESNPMNTNMIEFRCFFKNLYVLVLWPKVASALEGLKLKFPCIISMTVAARPLLFH